MPRLALPPDDARLVYLAAVYHLGRPGSETDAATLQRHDLGLGPVREALAPQLDQATAELELTPYQIERLGVALHGVVNELKQYELADRRSAVPGFVEALHETFEDADEPGAALDLAQQAVLLRRRLDDAVRDAGAQVAAAREAQLEERPSDPWWRKAATLVTRLAKHT